MIRIKPIIWVIILSLSVSACNLPVKQDTVSINEEDLVKTAYARTVEVMMTELAREDTPSSVDTESPEQPTQATNTPLPATTTPQPSQSPVPSSPTKAPEICDRGDFVGETIPDGTAVQAGQTFTKVWTLKNTGSCTWTSNYAVVFVQGEAMGGQTKQLTTGNIKPGETVQVSIDLKSPSKVGSYRGEWMLRNNGGVLFGLGSDAAKRFWVDIKVQGTLYSFLDQLCSASWRSGAGNISCPGTPGDSNGYAVKLDRPEFENGMVDDEPAILISPQNTTDGFIAGEFPAISITNGSKFKTVLGCQSGAIDCSVKITLAYKADGGAETTLVEWIESYDANLQPINLDLSSLAGKNVVFIFYVKANGTANDDQLLMLLPRIE
jgi:hypothetical protein